MKMPPVPDLSDELRKTRDALGLSVREVEERCGVNKSMLSRLETGTLKNPSLRVMRALTSLYQLPTWFWFQ